MKTDKYLKQLDDKFLADTFAWFLPILEKLKREFRTGEYTWWRSRFYEAIGYGGNMDHAAWELAHTREISFPYLWNKFRLYFTESHKTVSELKNEPKTLQLELF